MEVQLASLVAMWLMDLPQAAVGALQTLVECGQSSYNDEVGELLRRGSRHCLAHSLLNGLPKSQ